MVDVDKFIPTENITLFRSCLVSAEYPGVEASTKFVFDKLGVEYVIDRNQSCCTGLGHYYDIFDELSTTALAARNFSYAIRNNHKQYVPMCATCYAILKTSAKILNEKDDVREEINKAFRENGLEEFQYNKGDIDPRDDITHVVDVLYYLKDKIPEFTYETGILNVSSDEPIIIEDYSETLGSIIIDTKAENQNALNYNNNINTNLESQPGKTTSWTRTAKRLRAEPTLRIFVNTASNLLNELSKFMRLL